SLLVEAPRHRVLFRRLAVRGWKFVDGSDGALRGGAGTPIGRRRSDASGLRRGRLWLVTFRQPLAGRMSSFDGPCDRGNLCAARNREVRIATVAWTRPRERYRSKVNSRIVS